VLIIAYLLIVIGFLLRFLEKACAKMRGKWIWGSVNANPDIRLKLPETDRNRI